MERDYVHRDAGVRRVDRARDHGANLWGGVDALPLKLSAGRFTASPFRALGNELEVCRKVESEAAAGPDFYFFCVFQKMPFLWKAL
eukprot:5776418-Amphidinium_carterae.2